jgi:signal transduction histidine kinase
LLGIRERAAIAGGSLVVDSAPGHGTRIALRIPLAPETVMPREVSA